MSKKQIPIKPKAKEVAILADPNAMKKLKISLGIIIGVFAFLLYAQSITFNYALDDITVINQNNFVKKGFAGIADILKTDYWCGYVGNNRVPEYRPASLILFAIEWQFFQDNLHVYHLVNIFLFSFSYCNYLFYLNNIFFFFLFIYFFFFFFFFLFHIILCS